MNSLLLSNPPAGTTKGSQEFRPHGSTRREHITICRQVHAQYHCVVPPIPPTNELPLNRVCNGGSSC
jgi:hypothetical protein